jgi:hypothetical protein
VRFEKKRRLRNWKQSPYDEHLLSLDLKHDLELPVEKRWRYGIINRNAKKNKFRMIILHHVLTAELFRNGVKRNKNSIVSPVCENGQQNKRLKIIFNPIKYARYKSHQMCDK